MASSATINKIERAHQMYREGRYAEALGFYTDALSLAKTKSQKIALHSNRAACFLKLHDFKKAADECTLVLELDQKHTGALMLRAQTLVTLKEYHSALFDVNRLIELNPSSEVYQNLHARLKTQLSLAPIPEDEAELDEDDDLKVDWEEQCTNRETNEVDVGEDKRDVVEVTTIKAESGSVKQTTEVSDVPKMESSEQQSERATKTGISSARVRWFWQCYYDSSAVLIVFHSGKLVSRLLAVQFSLVAHCRFTSLDA
ncbi:hypothetical protein H5410_039349 [Solanum commersonii]|uniref:Uncharacterized protein n=1 Tax=Solanum commersonii TaxID=4109 RepID=A0A9J5YDD7_SOLCO|nr:hypothetical protein H5410_039349 [Solanum commersonii]